jgi:citrate lyase subunit beta/citryl-CoA lyase
MKDTAAYDGPSFPLFVPADRPDRFAKACAAGTDSVIIDMEDAVPPQSKDAVRRIPHGSLPQDRAARLYLRINATDTPWYSDDVAFARVTGFDGVILPKTESVAQLEALRAALPQGCTVIALVETAAGMAAVGDIAHAADRMAFGSIDLAQDLGCAHTQTALLSARSAIVMAARLAGRPAPIDGVTTATMDPALTTQDAEHARDMGFGGKLLIHPAQIAPARAAFSPTSDELAWAQRVIDATTASTGTTVTVDGAMVDAPVVARAQRILDRERAMK